MLRTIAAGVLGAVLLGACAGAAPGARVSRAAKSTWSTPVNISASAIGVNWNASLAFTGDGHALATLDGRYEGQLTSVLAADPGSSAFAEIGKALLLAAPAPYGSDGMAYLRIPTPTPSGRADKAIDYAPVTQLGVSLGSVPGSLGDLQPLASVSVPPRGVRAAISGDPRGDVAAAWIEPAGKGQLLRLALRAPGQAFAAPTTLAQGRDLNNVALAYGAGGDLVVAFDRGRAEGDVAVRVLRPGHGFGPIQSLGRSRGSSSLAVAVSPRGRAVVGWGTQDASYDLLQADSPWSVRAARLSPGVQRFAATQLLDRGHDVAVRVGGVHAAIAPDGTATIAWTGAGAKGIRPNPSLGRPYPSPVRVATSAMGGRFGHAHQLARNGVALGVVTANNATTTVLWGLFAKPQEVDDYVESLDRTYASRRTRGEQRFGRPRAISAHEPIKNGGSIALDPTSQRPSALWIEAVGGSLGEGLIEFPHVEALYAAGPDSTAASH